MARISGVNIPSNKSVGIALTAIFGIGRFQARRVCDISEVEASRLVSSLSEEEVIRIRETIDNDFVIEGDLRREISMNIKSLMDLGCYRGLRHRKGLPVRGQRTITNARTRKGKTKPIAGKKK